MQWARVRTQKALRMAVIVAVLVAALLWKTQWPTLRPGLILLLVVQVALALFEFAHLRRLRLDPLDRETWIANERRSIRMAALLEGGGRFAAFALLAYGFWQWTGNLLMAVLLGVVYPLVAWLVLVRGNERRALRQLTPLLLLAALGLHAQAPSNPNPKPKPLGEDWISLFNGQDLNGWVKIGKESWTVEDGIIHGKGVTQDYGYLQTERPFHDFQLSLRFKCEGDGNSGVFFHTAFKPGTADITQGLQFEVDCTIGKHTAGLYGDGRGWIVWPAPENETVVRLGEWNEYVLEVMGNRYRARLNGVQMVDFTDPKPKSFDGPIALQLHSGGRGDMKFKDILVRDLSAH